MKRILLLLGLALLALATRAEPLAFGLFGDTPYTRWEREHLPELIGEMDGNSLAFVIHVGDIKAGDSACSDEVLKDILAVFQQSKHPLVYLPGDNEWADCHRKSNGRYDPLERLERLRDWFFAGDAALGRRPLRLERQSRNPAFARYRENVRWEAGGALFVGLNVTGSGNNFHGTRRSGGPVPEFIERSAANRAWLAESFALARTRKLAGILIAMQGNPGFHVANAGNPAAGYRELLHQLREEARAFSGQVVLVHGDTHRYRVDQPLADPDSGETLRNVTRVETMGSPFFGWVLGSVDTADPRVFRFSPRVWQAPRPAN